MRGRMDLLQIQTQGRGKSRILRPICSHLTHLLPQRIMHKRRMEPARCEPKAMDDLKAAQHGDRQAFRRVVEVNHMFAYRVALGALGNSEEAGETAQEAFIRVWKHLPAFDMNKRFTTWLYTIVTRLCIDRIRARQRRAGFLVPLDDRELRGASFDEHVERSIDLRDRVALIRSTIPSLPPKQRLVFILRDLEDLSIAEISDICALSPESVRTSLSVARRRIRLALVRALGEEVSVL